MSRGAAACSVNQEPTGDWVANERASDRRNSEPGITDRERKRRKY